VDGVARGVRERSLARVAPGELPARHAARSRAGNPRVL
jgi:hypothetical protein